ncbi:MAG: hypothetical protein JNK82_24220 [Myxococcaceae bacterium]|nr:hypothetical protein [Myxococcaceae bacterium]
MPGNGLHHFFTHLDLEQPAMHVRLCPGVGPELRFDVVHVRRPPASKTAVEGLPPELAPLWARHDGLMLYCDAKWAPPKFQPRQELEAGAEDLALLRFEPADELPRLKRRLADDVERYETELPDPNAVPFATLSMSSDVFAWCPAGVFYLAVGHPARRIADSFDTFLEWLIEDPARALMSTASVARFYRDGQQYYPVGFSGSPASSTSPRRLQTRESSSTGSRTPSR